MFENFCSDVIQTMKCFALESFNLSCQAEHQDSGLALIAFWTTRPRFLDFWLIIYVFCDIGFDHRYSTYPWFIPLKFYKINISRELFVQAVYKQNKKIVYFSIFDFSLWNFCLDMFRLFLVL